MKLRSRGITALGSRGKPVVAGEGFATLPEAMKPEFIVLALILLGALYLFWTQRLRTDITALLAMLSLALPWPRPDGKWSAILSPQEAFSGFGSVAVIMVTAMFVFSAAMVRTGAAEMIGGLCSQRTPLADRSTVRRRRLFDVHQ
jgi:di/tricarboxylate transporter